MCTLWYQVFFCSFLSIPLSFYAPSKTLKIFFFKVSHHLEVFKFQWNSVEFPRIILLVHLVQYWPTPVQNLAYTLPLSTTTTAIQNNIIQTVSMYWYIIHPHSIWIRQVCQTILVMIGFYFIPSFLHEVQNNLHRLCLFILTILSPLKKVRLYFL